MKTNTAITALLTLVGAGLLVVSTAPALALDDDAAGSWDGTLERKNGRQPIAMRFTEEEGIWRGRLEIEGASSTMESLKVDGDHVHFVLPGQGVFDGRISNDSLVGSVTGSKPGSFAVTRQGSEDPFGDPIESEGP